MDEKIVQECVERMLFEGMGLSPSDPHLSNTPSRITRMFCRELFTSVGKQPPKLTKFENAERYNEIVLLDNIPFTSVCAHHFMPFQGKAWFAYIPDKYVVGASKVSRLINYYSSMPQIQENLTECILLNFVGQVEPSGAMLVMRAIHGCMSCRGIRQANGGGMITSCVWGAFKERIETRNEALKLIEMSQREML